MVDHVLVPTDGSPLASRALTYALETFPGARITTMVVIDPVESLYDVETGGPRVAGEWAEKAEERAEEVHDESRSTAAEYDVEVETVTRNGRPAEEILAYVDEEDVDQIVLGSHGRKGVERVLLGSVAEHVARDAHVPVTIVS
jgi:nucleotide-binding universal stress UspA family protein